MWGDSKSASKNTSDPILKMRKERFLIFPLACDLVLAAKNIQTRQSPVNPSIVLSYPLRNRSLKIINTIIRLNSYLSYHIISITHIKSIELNCLSKVFLFPLLQQFPAAFTLSHTKESVVKTFPRPHL